MNTEKKIVLKACNRQCPYHDIFKSLRICNHPGHGTIGKQIGPTAMDFPKWCLLPDDFIPNDQPGRFRVGDRVFKPEGYSFDGVVVAVFKNTKGQTRIVAELEGNGMLHIFSEKQLELREDQP